MNWETQKQSKNERLAAASSISNGKVVATEDVVKLLEAVIHSEDKVVLEGCNQKQAAFLAGALTQVDAGKMSADGIPFYLSKNGVWLVKEVPMQYLTFI